VRSGMRALEADPATRVTRRGDNVASLIGLLRGPGHKEKVLCFVVAYVIECAFKKQSKQLYIYIYICNFMRLNLST